MKRFLIIAAVFAAVAMAAHAAAPLSTNSSPMSTPTAGWDAAAQAFRAFLLDANGYLLVAIPGGIGTVSVTIAPLQTASTTVSTLTANTELIPPNITGQTLLSLQNQGTGDVWFKINASATVSSGYKIPADGAVELRMLSTDNVSVISSVTPTLVLVKQ